MLYEVFFAAVEVILRSDEVPDPNDEVLDLNAKVPKEFDEVADLNAEVPNANIEVVLSAGGAKTSGIKISDFEEKKPLFIFGHGKIPAQRKNNKRDSVRVLHPAFGHRIRTEALQPLPRQNHALKLQRPSSLELLPLTQLPFRLRISTNIIRRDLRF